MIVVEHLCDRANFVAFGPGSLHFHSREAWQSSWQGTGFEIADEFSLTPWVRGFALTVR